MFEWLPVLFQLINVNQTTPCFLNFSAGVNIWHNCGMDKDFLKASLVGWEWVTGGNFSLILVSIFTTFSYIKYHKAIYPILVGTLFLPIAFFVFPEVFLTWGFVMTAMALGILIWYVIVSQTNES